MLRAPLSRSWRIGLGATAFLVLIGGYSVLSYRQQQENPNDRSVPSLGQLWSDGVVKVVTPDTKGDIWLWEDALSTFVFRLFPGLTIGVLVSIVAGILMGCYTPVEAFLLPPLAFLAKIPPTAMLAVFFIMVGTSNPMFITMISFGVVPVLAQTVYHAAKEDVPAELLNKAYTLGASQFECVWNVVYRHILPRLLDGVRLQIGPAMVYLVAAEYIVAQVGFGFHIRMQQRLLDMSVVYVYLIVLGAAGFGLDYLLIRIRRSLCPWYGH
jgi:NitT/TauT family transport system permease protein